jgi:hypothetical protein
MAINASAYWRVRIGGADTNGGGFDPNIVGAGTDYTEQDTPQLTVTDLAAASGSPNVSSATGGFTAAMIGNAVSVSGGTGWTTAARYFITAVTDSNNAVLDRAASAGAASGGTCRVGGALATVYLLTSSYAVAGNTIYIRGQGSNNPIDIDYYTNTQVNSGTSYLSYIGYNGRPKISHRGDLWWQQNYGTWENFYFIQTAGTTTDKGVLANNAYGAGCLAYNCVFDSGGFDATLATDVGCIQCTFQNTGGQTAGTKFAYVADSTACGVAVPFINNLVKDLRGGGVSVYDHRAMVVGNVIQNCLGDGLYVVAGANTQNVGLHIQNTIYNCGGDGISVPDSTTLAFTNLVTNITGSGKYGIKVRDSVVRGVRNSKVRTARNNIYGCTTATNISGSAHDLAIDPTYANAPTDLTPTNTALRFIGGVGAL